jgi:pimeloyl-ACP methyl ester carboxylesterase
MAHSDASFVLVHGGSSTGRFWDRLLPHLDRPALAVDLPGRGPDPVDMMELTVDDCVDSVVAAVHESQLQDVVIVAHSSGGLVVPGLVARLEGRVRGIVLNAASVPPEGGCGLDCMQPQHRAGVVAFFESARREGRVVTTPLPDDPERLRRSYGETLDDETVRFMSDPARTVTDSFNLYYQPIHWSQVGDTPVTYVRNRRDRPIPVELQDEMIGRLTSPTVVDLDTGHIPAVTHPSEFAAICNQAARAPHPNRSGC